jgi:ferredoxin
MNAGCYSIEENIDFEELTKAEEIIGFCYPVYFSRVPRIMREFTGRYMSALKNKKVIIFCTQMILSGDGARAFAALFPRNHVQVIYAEHFFMPNNVTNFRILPDWLISAGRVKKSAFKAEHKMLKVCRNIKREKVKKRGFNLLSRVLGLPQAALLQWAEKKANKSVRISGDCTNCGLCVKLCPMKNLVCQNSQIIHNHNCIICYRCVNKCPKKAITVGFHGKVKKQYKGICDCN